MANHINSNFNKLNIQYCQYCGKVCKNRNSLLQHECRCKENTSRIKTYFVTNNPSSSFAGPWNKGKTKESDSRVAKHAAAVSLTKKGKPGHKHSKEEKEHLRECALKNGLGGFHMRRGIYYNGIKLDSSYEVIVAEILDANNIKWERCKRIPYTFEGKLHYYTPDFYLPDYGIYLDPKNDFLINNVNPSLGYSDREKIDVVSAQTGFNIIVLAKDQLNWDYIKTLLQFNGKTGAL